MIYEEKKLQETMRQKMVSEATEASNNEDKSQKSVQPRVTRRSKKKKDKKEGKWNRDNCGKFLSTLNATFAPTTFDGFSGEKKLKVLLTTNKKRALIYTKLSFIKAGFILSGHVSHIYDGKHLLDGRNLHASW